MRNYKHKLLTDAEREALAKKLHELHVRRLLVGTVLVLVGFLMPDFEPHLVHAMTAEGVRAVGYLPFLKLAEDLVFTA